MGSSDLPQVVVGNGDVMTVHSSVSISPDGGSETVTGVSVDRADGTVERHERGPDGWRQVAASGSPS